MLRVMKENGVCGMQRNVTRRSEVNRIEKTRIIKLQLQRMIEEA